VGNLSFCRYITVAMFAEVIPPRVCSSFWTITRYALVNLLRQKRAFERDY
jgi:hypothetical protein